MIAKITETAVAIETLLTMLPDATWHYHPPSGDMDIVFAGGAGCCPKRLDSGFRRNDESEVEHDTEQPASWYP